MNEDRKESRGRQRKETGEESLCVFVCVYLTDAEIKIKRGREGELERERERERR